jgi:hypothetical protein
MVISSSILEFLNSESLKTIKNFENIDKLSNLKIHYVKQFSYQYLKFKLLELFFDIQEFLSPIKEKKNEIKKEINVLIEKYKNKHEHYIELSFDPHERYFRKLNGEILSELLLEKYNEKGKSVALNEFLEKRYFSKPFSSLTNKEIDEFISNKFFGNSNKIDLIEKSFLLRITPIVKQCEKSLLSLFKKKCKFKNTGTEILEYFENILIKKFEKEYHLLNLPQYIKNLVIKDCKFNNSISIEILGEHKKLNECEKLIVFLTNEFIVKIIPKNIIEYEDFHFLKLYIKLDYFNYYKIFEKDTPIYELFDKKNNERLKKEREFIDFIIEHNYKLFNFLYPSELKNLTVFKLKDIEQTRNLIFSNIVINIMNNNVLVEPILSFEDSNKSKCIDIKNFKILIVDENREIAKYFKIDNNLIENFTFKMINLENCIYKFFKTRTKLDIEKEIKILNQFLYRIS